MKLEGVVPPMITPTSADREIDVSCLQSYTKFLVDSGVHALFPCGSTGEFPSLTSDQRKRVITTVAENADGTPVLAGCGDTSLVRIIEQIEHADRAGADAAIVVTPYYLGQSQVGLRRFFELVADESDLPIILYEIPSFTGQQMTVQTIVELTGHDNVVGLKDSSGDLVRLFDIVNATPRSFSIFQGMSELATASLDIGVDGLVAGPACVFPSEIAMLYDAYRAGDRVRSTEMMNEVMHPVVSATRPLSTPVAIKYLLQLRGYDIGPPIPPLSSPTPAERRSLERCYDAVQSITSAI